jgi:hypothetical protein
MNYNIKHIFTANDLEIGDLLYDVEKNTLAVVVLVGQTVTKTAYESTLFGCSSKTITTRQIILEDTNTKEIYIVSTIGSDGKTLPTGRFRFLIKHQEPVIINNPVYPYYPSYPDYPNYPYNP